MKKEVRQQSTADRTDAMHPLVISDLDGTLTTKTHNEKYATDEEYISARMLDKLTPLGRMVASYSNTHILTGRQKKFAEMTYSWLSKQGVCGAFISFRPDSISYEGMRSNKLERFRKLLIQAQDYQPVPEQVVVLEDEVDLLKAYKEVTMNDPSPFSFIFLLVKGNTLELL